VREETRRIIETLEKERVPVDPWVAERYIGTKLRSLGIRAPVIHAMAKKFSASHQDAELDDVHTITDELWRSYILEARGLATSILARYSKRLDRSSFDLISEWYDDVDNWANCDGLSVFVLSEFMFKDDEVTSRVREWISSPNPWRRRGAVTSTIPANREGRSDPQVVLEMVRALLDDDEYFVKKSLGWVLRELGKSRPEIVASFLRKHRKKLNREQLKKAVKYLPAGDGVGILE
jgi:3-methyladenine DNA glycosylase AlkD